MRGMKIFVTRIGGKTVIFKIIGSVLVLSSTVVAGFYYGNLDSYRISDLLEMKKALAILKSEIEFAKTPLPEALMNIGTKTKKPISNIFLRLEELLHVERGANIGDLWNQTLKEFEKQTYFNIEDVDQLISFGKTLGYLSQGMQLSNIKIMTSYIDEKVGSLNVNRFKNKRMFQSFGVLGGILVVVIFI